MNSYYNFFYDLSYEDFENEDENVHIVYDKHYRKTKRSHKLYAMKLSELQNTLALLQQNIEQLHNI